MGQNLKVSCCFPAVCWHCRWIVALPLILRRLMASPSHFQFHPVTVTVRGCCCWRKWMLIEGRIEPTTTSRPRAGTDRYLGHECHGGFTSSRRSRNKVTSGSRNGVAYPKTSNKLGLAESRLPSVVLGLVSASPAPPSLSEPCRAGSVMAMPSFFCYEVCRRRVQTVPACCPSFDEKRTGEPRGRSAFNHTSNASMVALHQWTSSADHSLDLACGRLSAHAKLGLCMVATAWPCHSPPSFH